MTRPAGHLELARLRLECPIAEPRPGVKMIVGCDEAIQILRDTTRFSGRHDDTRSTAMRGGTVAPTSSLLIATQRCVIWPSVAEPTTAPEPAWPAPSRCKRCAT
jgi:hypothetical protein